MIDDKRYPSSSRPALKPESIGYPKKNAAVLTIASVEPYAEIPDEGGETRTVLTLVVEEFPDLTFYSNANSRKALIERLGRDERKWVSQRVPFVVVTTNNPKTHKTQPSLWVAPADEWDAHLSRGGRRRR